MLPKSLIGAFTPIKEKEEPEEVELQDSHDATAIAGQTLNNDEKILEVLQFYSETDDRIPKELKDKNWAIFDKTLPLSFLPEKSDDIVMEATATISKIDAMINTPPYMQNFSDMQKLNQMKLFLFLNGRRAKGIKNANITNERTLHETQIAQVITSRKKEQEKRKRFGWG